MLENDHFRLTIRYLQFSWDKLLQLVLKLISFSSRKYYIIVCIIKYRDRAINVFEKYKTLSTLIN